MARERAERSSHHQGSHLKALLNGRVLLICFIYFLNTLVTYGVFLWLPTHSARRVGIIAAGG